MRKYLYVLIYGILLNSCFIEGVEKPTKQILIDSIDLSKFDTIIIGTSYKKGGTPNISYTWEKYSHPHQFFKENVVLDYYESFKVDSMNHHITSIIIKKDILGGAYLELLRCNFGICSETPFDKKIITRYHPVTGETLCITQNFFGTKKVNSNELNDVLNLIKKSIPKFEKVKSIGAIAFYSELKYPYQDSIYTYSTDVISKRNNFYPIRRIKMLLK